MDGPELSLDEARRLALRAQGLLGAPGHGSGANAVSGLLRRLRAVQLDTISVLARSHELIPYARLGPVGRRAVERAYWSGGCFEYWAHAACVLPVEDWSFYAFRRRHFLERGMRWHDRPSDAVFAEVRARLADGHASTGDLGGAKKGGPWWDWSGAKVAVEFLLDTGEVVCARREGWRRIYDLADRAIPAEHRAADNLDDAACHRELVARAGVAMGVATVGDLADYPRISKAAVAAVLPDTGLVPVSVAGWREQAWADPGALETLGARGRHRTTLLSPFDSLIWDRARTKRLFGFTHALEAYKPAPKREYGYFAMPLLTGGRLLGRVDPKRVGSTLVAQAVFLDSPAAARPVAAALHETAAWVGAEEIQVDRVFPDSLAGPVTAALLA